MLKASQSELILMLQKQNAALKKSLAEQTALVAKLSKDLALALEKINAYEEQLKLMRQRQFGRRSETSHSLQGVLPLFDGIDVAPESAPEKETLTYTRAKRKPSHRQLDTSKLPRMREYHDLSDDEKSCTGCGNKMVKVGEATSETVELIPRQLYVIEQVRPAYACKPCGTLKQSPSPLTSPLPKSLAGSSLIAEVIINKYQHHQPLYRQSQHFKSHGMLIPDNTLGHWVMASGEQLKPLKKALWTEMTASGYLQVDETPVKVLSDKKKGYMWVYLSPLAGKRLALFDYSASRASVVVEHRLKGFTGLLQSDGYAGYSGLRKQPAITGLGCFAHARRKFIEVIKVAGGSQGRATEILEEMNALYRIERHARTENLSSEERALLRQQQAPPIIASLEKLLQETHAPPQSGLGKAIRYTVSQWPYLVAYLQHGEAEIDNNWVENQIRPFALGRRNWLFMGHHESAQLGGLLHSLVQSAKLNELNPYNYIHYLLTQVHALRREEIDPVSLLAHRVDPAMLRQFAESHQQRAQQVQAVAVYPDDQPSVMVVAA